MKDRIRDNPFYVLGVRPEADRPSIEREGQKLLGMLALGLKSAASYATPVGPGVRTDEKVRHAMAELRDPDRRLSHELWARLEAPRVAAPDPAAPGAEASRADLPWPGALAALGWAAP